mmetsp:Transcript_2249/g.2696  ORF Transcript_2249/g.2696 Transcript_2249/m.2696 type:complete len:303 (+) Transcript_2249:216-1124(+)
MNLFTIHIFLVSLLLVCFCQSFFVKPLNNNPEIKTMQSVSLEERHFIFGYGSLICHRSRAITAPSLASRPAEPVVIEHLIRTWTARVPFGKKKRKRTIHGQTAMGIERANDKKCCGVLIEVDEVELESFDLREAGYDRVQIDLLHIWGLNEEKYNDAHVVLEQACKKRGSSPLNNESIDEIKVWVYLPQTCTLASKNFPICQSYVDIILRGCLDYGIEFVNMFLETTHGWWHVKTRDAIGNHFIWVDDRRKPFYSRADIDWSTEKSTVIDKFLEDQYPNAFKQRRHLDKILGAIEKDEDEFD